MKFPSMGNKTTQPFRVKPAKKAKEEPFPTSSFMAPPIPHVVTGKIIAQIKDLDDFLRK